jgi:tol-pal system-associated acyl-CoA thioesterase
MQHCTTVRVYYEDTDAGGIVYYVNYLKYCERARTEWLRSLGFSQQYLLSKNVQFVVVDVKISYQRPAKLDDELQIHIQNIKLGRASLVFEQKILRDSELICTAQVKIACVNADQLKPIPLPIMLKTAVKGVIKE